MGVSKLGSIVFQCERGVILDDANIMYKNTLFSTLEWIEHIKQIHGEKVSTSHEKMKKMTCIINVIECDSVQFEPKTKQRS
jgi:hypothetical protein